MRAAFVRHTDNICAAFIRGRRLFEGGVYIRKYGMLHARFSLQGMATHYTRGHYILLALVGLALVRCASISMSPNIPARKKVGVTQDVLSHCTLVCNDRI